MKKGIKILTLLLGIVLLLSLISILVLIKAESCDDLTCFRENLNNCNRATYTSSSEWAYEYKIIGKKQDSCIVDVKLVFAGMETKFDSLIGKSMRCSPPIGLLDLPEKNMDFCTGPLKQEIQYMVINELYKFTARNLGK